MGTTNQWRLLSLRSKLRHCSFHTLTGRSSEILNMCTVFKNHEPVHAKHGKCSFVPRGEYSRMRTINLDLIMQKGSRVYRMIIAHNSFFFILFTYFKLLWQWNSVYIALLVIRQAAIYFEADRVKTLVFHNNRKLQSTY